MFRKKEEKKEESPSEKKGSLFSPRSGSSSVPAVDPKKVQKSDSGSDTLKRSPRVSQSSLPVVEEVRPSAPSSKPSTPSAPPTHNTSNPKLPVQGAAPTMRGNAGASTVQMSIKQEKEFEEMMTAMNLPPAGRQQMLALPPQQKLDLLENHKAKLKSVRVTDKGGKVKNSPQFFVNQLQTPNAHDLQTLRVCAVSEPIIWLETFDSLGGIAMVVKIVQDLEKKRDKTPEDNEIMLEAVRCVVSMCKADGLKMVTAVPNVVGIFALCLDTRESVLKIEIYDFLSLLCNLMGQYYQMVVDAMDTYKFQKREAVKFQHLVQSLQHEENPTVQARALQLINSIISAPQDLDQRVNMRNAFLRLGVRDVMNRVKKTIPHNADYATQFDSFILDEKEDTAALQSVIPGYVASADASDDRGMFEAIKKKVDPNNLLQSQFQSVMGSLLRLPTNDTDGVKVWNLVSTLLQQISQGTGYLAVDGEFVLDVQELLNSNALRAELEITKADHKNLQQTSQEQTKKLREENRNLKDELSAVKAKLEAPKEQSGPTPEEIKKLQDELSETKEMLEEANYNAEKAGSRVVDLMAVIQRHEEAKEMDKVAKAKEIEAINDAHETERAQIWNERMVEVARKEEEIAALKRSQLDTEAKLDVMERKVKEAEMKLKQFEASGATAAKPVAGSAIESDALLKWAQSQEELSQVRNELNELKKDYAEVNADRAKLATKAAEAKQKIEDQLIDVKQSLEIAKRARESAEKKAEAMDSEMTTLKKELDELKAAVASGAAVAAAGGSGAPPPPPDAPPGPDGGSFAPPPPPPPPPGAGDFGGPPPPPPPPGGDFGGPPPPPPPPGGGPPPPPPPPGGAPGAPPPPPGPPGAPPAPGAPGMPAFAPVKKWRPNLPKPSVKTKQLNWDKMPQNLAEKSVFNDLKEGLENLPIDWTTVEKLFAAPVAVPKGGAGGHEGGKKEPTEVQLLDPKRAHAIGIYLRRMSFNVSIENVVECIATFDRSTIDLEFIERLIFNAPQPDEVAMIKQFVADGGDANMLGKPEKFFLALGKIPSLVARLQSYKTVLTFKKRADATKGQISGLRDAFDQLINSERFRELLKVVLALGNFLNGRSARGDAIGFKMKSITTLTDTKTADNKSTLLHWIIQHLQSTSPGTLSVTAELAGVPEASGSQWDQLQNDIAGLKKDQVALANASINVPIMEGEEFRDAWPRIVTSELVAEYAADVEAMERGIASASTEWNTLAAMFGEDPAATKPEQLLADIATFVNSFNNIRKELAMSSGAAGAGAALKRKEVAGHQEAAAVDADVDELRSQIQSGAAFENRREQRRAARTETLRGVNK